MTLCLVNTVPDYLSTYQALKLPRLHQRSLLLRERNIRFKRSNYYLLFEEKQCKQVQVMYAKIAV